jgi:hypothetical protein
MAPNAGGVPTDTLGSVIKGILDEEDFTAFKEKLGNNLLLLGSLIVDKGVKVTSSQNQDNPLMKNAPIQERLY